MWRFPFLIYCVVAWEYFLFEPLIALNLLMIGLIVVGRYRERQAAKAHDEVAGQCAPAVGTALTARFHRLSATPPP